MNALCQLNKHSPHNLANSLQLARDGARHPDFLRNCGAQNNTNFPVHNENIFVLPAQCNEGRPDMKRSNQVTRQKLSSNAPAGGKSGRKFGAEPNFFHLSFNFKQKHLADAANRTIKTKKWHDFSKKRT